MFEKFLTDTLKLAYRQMWGVNQLGTYFKQLFSFSPKKVVAAIVAIFEVFSLVIFDTPTTPRGPELDLTGYEVVFEDNFDGDKLDETKWERCPEWKRQDLNCYWDDDMSYLDKIKCGP